MLTTLIVVIPLLWFHSIYVCHIIMLCLPAPCVNYVSKEAGVGAGGEGESSPLVGRRREIAE